MASSPEPQPSRARVGVERGGIVAVAVAAILSTVYAAEGGFVDHPSDPGGPTNYGVTQRVARQAGYTGNMRDFPKHCAEVAPSEVCADKIYVARYIEGPGYMPLVAIEPAVAEELVDTTVNMGPPRPSRWFQQAINEMGSGPIVADGQVGPSTIAAYVRLQKIGPSACVAMLDRLDAKQAAEYRRLIQVNPKLGVFLKGWLRNRIGNVDRRKCTNGAAA